MFARSHCDVSASKQDKYKTCLLKKYLIYLILSVLTFFLKKTKKTFQTYHETFSSFNLIKRWSCTRIELGGFIMARMHERQSEDVISHKVHILKYITLSSVYMVRDIMGISVISITTTIHRTWIHKRNIFFFLFAIHLFFPPY